MEDLPRRAKYPVKQRILGRDNQVLQVARQTRKPVADVALNSKYIITRTQSAWRYRRPGIVAPIGALVHCRDISASAGIVRIDHDFKMERLDREVRRINVPEIQRL